MSWDRRPGVAMAEGTDGPLSRFIPARAPGSAAVRISCGLMNWEPKCPDAGNAIKVRADRWPFRKRKRLRNYPAGDLGSRPDLVREARARLPDQIGPRTEIARRIVPQSFTLTKWPPICPDLDRVARVGTLRLPIHQTARNPHRRRTRSSRRDKTGKRTVRTFGHCDAWTAIP